MSPGDKDCHCDKNHISPTAPIDLSFLDNNYTDIADTLYEFKPDIRTPKRRKEHQTPYKPQNWRADYSADKLLEHDLESFDFILNRLLTQDSPYHPDRTFPLSDPGCPACDPWQWKYLADELEGHDDWFLAWDPVSGFMKLGTKLSGIKILLHRLQWECI
ncbi:MAG: hypothetical protein Q9192_006995 [Flavoplaca navasiana]